MPLRLVRHAGHASMFRSAETVAFDRWRTARLWRFWPASLSGNCSRVRSAVIAPNHFDARERSVRLLFDGWRCSLLLILLIAASGSSCRFTGRSIDNALDAAQRGPAGKEGKSTGWLATPGFADIQESSTVRNSHGPPWEFLAIGGVLSRCFLGRLQTALNRLMEYSRRGARWHVYGPWRL